MQRIVRLLIWGVPVIGLAGCDGRALDPEQNPLSWKPQGINNANIAAEVANPAELAHGQAATGADGQQMAAAIRHWRGLPPPSFAAQGTSSDSVDSSGGGGSAGSSSGGTP